MREITYKENLSVIERLCKQTEQKYGETNDSRFLALYDLSRKMRACLNAVMLLPHEEYEVLCVPINLLYRCMITDLMTALLISVVDDETFCKVMNVMDIGYANSLKKAIDAEIKVKKSICSEKESAFDEAAKEYQSEHYKDFKDCLKSQEGELWDVKSREKISINNVPFY